MGSVDRVVHYYEEILCMITWLFDCTFKTKYVKIKFCFKLKGQKDSSCTELVGMLLLSQLHGFFTRDTLWFTDRFVGYISYRYYNHMEEELQGRKKKRKNLKIISCVVQLKSCKLESNNFNHVTLRLFSPNT